MLCVCMPHSVLPIMWHPVLFPIPHEINYDSFKVSLIEFPLLLLNPLNSHWVLCLLSWEFSANVY